MTDGAVAVDPSTPPVPRGEARRRRARRRRMTLLVGGLLLVVAGVTAAVVAATSGSPPPAPRDVAASTATGYGYSCSGGTILLTWTSRGAAVQGVEATTSGSLPVTGTQQGSHLHLVTSGGGRSLTATVAGDTLVLRLDGVAHAAPLRCALVSKDQWEQAAARLGTGGVTRQAEDNLVTTVTALKGQFAAAHTYGSALAAAGFLHTAVPSLDFVTGAATAPPTVSLRVLPGSAVVVLAAPDGTGQCLFAADNEGAPVASGPAPAPAVPAGTSYASARGAQCDANALPAGLTWAASFPPPG